MEFSVFPVLSLILVLVIFWCDFNFMCTNQKKGILEKPNHNWNTVVHIIKPRPQISENLSKMPM